MFDASVNQTLCEWFHAHGTDKTVEAEARIKNVGAHQFNALLAHLTHAKKNEWAHKPEEETTVDLIHQSGVRESVHLATGARSYLRKSRMHDFTVEPVAGHPVRFTISSERECAADSSPVVQFRRKKRIRFVRKHMFSYELTTVNQGDDEQMARASPVQYEVELEFCGQKLSPFPKPQYLADSMLMKLSDCLMQVVQAASNPPPALRSKAAPSGLEECMPTSLKPGTSVLLEPSGQTLAAPFGGEMPAELAARVPWLFSHVDKSDDGSQYAYLMNMPCSFGERAYPLYFLYGRVPLDCVVPSGSR